MQHTFGKCPHMPPHTVTCPVNSPRKPSTHQYWAEAGETHTAPRSSEPGGGKRPMATHKTGSRPHVRNCSMAASIASHANASTDQRRGLKTVGTILCAVLIGRYKHHSGAPAAGARKCSAARQAASWPHSRKLAQLTACLASARKAECTQQSSRDMNEAYLRGTPSPRLSTGRHSQTTAQAEFHTHSQSRSQVRQETG